LTPLDSALFLIGLSAEAAIVAVILSKRIFRTFPVFSSYIIWSLLNDAGATTLEHFFPGSADHIYLSATVIDSLFQFAVLVELSMSVLRPVRASLPRAAVFAVSAIILLICAAVWPFAKTPGIEQFQLDSRLLIHLSMTFSVMRILFFLALAACSQLLSIGWRDRELQIATGLGIYSIASLSAALLHTNQSLGNPTLTEQYHLLDLMVVASYVCSIVYWIVSFAQKVPERREFTPQMQNFLLAVAGNARSTRLALDDSSDPRNRKTGKK
jgi:hypothetical protein